MAVRAPNGRRPEGDDDGEGEADGEEKSGGAAATHAKEGQWLDDANDPDDGGDE